VSWSVQRRHRPAFSSARSALPFECAVYRAARATAKEMGRRWLAAIKTQSDVKLEQPPPKAAWSRTAVRAAQRRKREEGQPNERHRHSLCQGAPSNARTTGGVRANSSTDGAARKKDGRLCQFKVDASWTRQQYTPALLKQASPRMAQHMIFWYPPKQRGEPAWISHGRYSECLQSL